MKSLSRHLTFYCSAGLLLFALRVQAQSVPGPSLDLAGALLRAAETNPTLAAQRFDERAAEARIEQAGQGPNPTLDLSLENFLGTDALRGSRGLEATLQASQTLERAGKRAKRVALASRERDVAARDYEVQRAEVLAQAGLAFAETVAAQQRLVLAEEPLRLARETLAAIDARVRAGAASTIEAARARAAVATARGEVVRAQAGLAAARAALAATWGGTGTEFGEIAGHIRLPEMPPGEAAFLAGLETHPRLGRQRAVIESLRASLRLEQSHRKEDISVGGGVRFLREGSDAALVASVSIPLPFRNRNEGKVRAARETLSGAEQTLRALEVELRAAVGAAWQELNAAHLAALNLRREILPANEEAFATVRRAYEGGELPLIDVFDAQRALTTVRREILDAESAYALALARLEGLTASRFPATAALFSSE